MKAKQQVKFELLNGIAYQEAWDYQHELHKRLIDRKRGLLEKEPPGTPGHHLLFCEHPHVFTLGKSGSMENLLLDDQELTDQGITFFKINRGGDITYHGPGQITGYPILDLDMFFTDVHKYVRYLEEAVIMALAYYGIQGFQVPDYTGVWVGKDDDQRKICAIGVHLSRWVTMHGFAFNINTDLSYFEKIIPCGINETGRSVTSLQQELGRPIDMDEARSILKEKLAEVFQFEYA